LVKKFKRFQKKPCDVHNLKNFLTCWQNFEAKKIVLQDWCIHLPCRGYNLKNFLKCWQNFEAKKIVVQDWCIHLLVGVSDPSSKLL
jgi:hypothetical protein